MTMENNNTSTVTRIGAKNNAILCDESNKEKVSDHISAAHMTLPKLPPIEVASATKNSSLFYNVPSDTSFNLTEETSIPDLAQHTKSINECFRVIVGICPILIA